MWMDKSQSCLTVTVASRFCPVSVCAELVMLLEWWSGTDCTLYTDQATVDKFGKEHVIIILNHNFEIDFLCGWTMCERYGVLGVSGPAGAVLPPPPLHPLPVVVFFKPHLCLAEFQSARQARAPQGPSDWLDLVLPGNSLLQAEVGGGPEDGVQWAQQTQRLS